MHARLGSWADVQHGGEQPGGADPGPFVGRAAGGGWLACRPAPRKDKGDIHTHLWLPLMHV